MTVIPLGPPLPTGSSRLPADSASSVVVRLFGVAPDGGCRVSPAPRRKRLVSVALFLAFASAARPRLLRPGVTRHPALWSPDFPLPRAMTPEAATIWQASRGDYKSARGIAAGDLPAERRARAKRHDVGGAECASLGHDPVGALQRD